MPISANLRFIYKLTATCILISASFSVKHIIPLSPDVTVSNGMETDGTLQMTESIGWEVMQLDTIGQGLHVFQNDGESGTRTWVESRASSRSALILYQTHDLKGYLSYALIP